ncbi:uncharacterized protein [Pseudochaenichthys georgianus]|uniref:uncharacterized protein isoform X2 n=1 Tax=Pseudochaenichthys georgianus TaxID=52239 RepID=UPI00146DAB53|nr:uncharacterized protein LOC117458874 isoform X2 [Pseudochaenichthys georgianus]
MGRVRRASGIPNKPDTPVRNKREKHKRLLPNKKYEAFAEEPGVEEMHVSTVKPTKPTHIKTVQNKSGLRLSRPPSTENSSNKTHAMPARRSSCRVSASGQQTIQTTPRIEAAKGGDMLVNDEEKNMTVTSEGVMSSSMESDTPFICNDDDDDDNDDDDDDDDDDEEEEDCFFASSFSSLPSPETFRRDIYVETSTFPIMEGLGLHLNIKNSTLLNVSNAETIHMHQPLNLSSIIDVSEIVDEKNCEINQHGRPEAETRKHVDSFKSEKALELNTPRKLTNRRTISYKKVSFKSPIIVDTLEAKYIPGSKLTIYHNNELAHTSSTSEQNETDTPSAGNISYKEKALKLKVRSKRPVIIIRESKFFDFIDDSDSDAFSDRMRIRCAKLRSAPLFPLTAPPPT